MHSFQRIFDMPTEVEGSVDSPSGINTTPPAHSVNGNEVCSLLGWYPLGASKSQYTGARVDSFRQQQRSRPTMVLTST